MKRYIIIFFLLAATLSAARAAELTFKGSSLPAIPVKPEASTGLDCLYVVDNSAGMTAEFTAETASATVTWYRYGASGGVYAEEVAVTRNGAVTSYTLPGEDLGLIIEEGTRRYYFYIVDHSRHPFSLSGLSVGSDSDCSSAVLIPDGTGAQIIYYTINGLPRELSRELTVEYTTLEADEAEMVFRQSSASETFPWLAESLRVKAPLCDTSFTLSGDRFMKQWGREERVTSGYYNAVAVDAITTAVQTERDADNESTDQGIAGLGGSAPVEITFTAAVSDAVRFIEWQFSTDPTFERIDLRYPQTEVTYTFRDYGITYVRFQGADNAGLCDIFSQTYEVSVGESKLQCPNAFSPGNQDGVNDEWKVSYRSIIEFECHIFNRWGLKMATLSDPSQGWDGRYGGKFVPSGVYYYVIKALGSDGRKYDLAGDINVINYRITPSSAPAE